MGAACRMPRRHRDAFLHPRRPDRTPRHGSRADFSLSRDNGPAGASHLKEHFTLWKALGIAAALLAVPLIAAQ